MLILRLFIVITRRVCRRMAATGASEHCGRHCSMREGLDAVELKYSCCKSFTAQSCVVVKKVPPGESHHLCKLLICFNQLVGLFIFEVVTVAQLSAHALGAEGLGLIPGPLKSAQCRQRLATAATFLRSCVAQCPCPGTKLRKWAPPLITRFDVTPRV